MPWHQGVRDRRGSLCCWALTRLLSPCQGCLTSLWVHREMSGFTGNAWLCLPLKSPPWDRGEEEPGVLMQQHPALPALRSALSDKRARRNRHGEHSQRHANGHCLFFFFFSSKIQKHPPHPPALAAAFRSEQSRGPAAALLSLLLLCGTALSS